MTLLIGVVLLVLAVLLSMRLHRAQKAAQLRAKAAARDELTKTGLTPSGDPLGTFELQGLMHDVEVTLENGTSIRPPGGRNEEGGHGDACVVRVAAPLADQLVCKLGEVDQMLGPLPTVPRLRTGHTQAAAGKPVPQIERGRRTVKHPRRDTNIGMYAVWAAALLFAIPGGMILSMASPLRALDDSLICGAGDRMIIYESNNEYGLGCAQQSNKPLLLHYVGSILVFVSLVVLIGVVLAPFSGSRSARRAA